MKGKLLLPNSAELSTIPLAKWLLLLCCTLFLGFYLRLPHPILGSLLLFALLGIIWASDHGEKSLTRRENTILGLFSGLFSLALVLGFHIVSLAPEKDMAFTDRFYLTPYALPDLPAFFLSAVAVFLLVRWMYRRLGSGRLRPLFFHPSDCFRLSPGNFLLVAGLLFLSGCAWLVVYYPGMIFPDTTGPLASALGGKSIASSRIAYMLFLRLGLTISRVLGKRNDIGVAFVTLLQIGFISLTLSFQICKLSAWFHLRKRWTLLLILLFALDPFFGSFSVIVWVNPLFSSGTVALSILLEEFLYRRRPGVLSLVLLFLVCLVPQFLRSNGVGIVFVMAFLCLVLWLLLGKAQRKNYGLAGLALCASLAFYSFASNVLLADIDSYEEISTDYGVFLNQMARVVVYDGDLSEEDLAYLDSILPLDAYAEAYNPGSVDFLKWHAEFRDEPLQDGFWGHYLSVLRKNPRICFEAWELQSHGFWTVNIPSINHDHSNITTGGNLLNTVGQDRLHEYGIEPGGLWQNPLLDTLFPLLWCAPPAGWIFWLLLLLAALILAARRYRLLIPLLPALLLMGSVALLTPTYYWQSYVMACYYLLPMFLLWFARIRNDAAPDASEVDNLAAQS